MFKVGDEVELICGFCESKLSIRSVEVSHLEVICNQCGQEKGGYNPKSGWHSYYNEIQLPSEEITIGTDLSYITVESNKTRNKIRRLFEGKKISSNHICSHILISILKDEDFEKIHFWEQRDSCYCRVKLKKYVNKRRISDEL